MEKWAFIFAKTPDAQGILSFYEQSIVKQCTALWQTCYGSNFVLSHLLLPRSASTVTCECQSGKPYTVELASSLLSSLCLIWGGSFVHRLDPSCPCYMRQKVLSKTPPTDTCLNLFLPPALGHLVNGKTVMKRERGKKPEMKWSPQHVWSLQQKQEEELAHFYSVSSCPGHAQISEKHTQYWRPMKSLPSG